MIEPAPQFAVASAPDGTLIASGEVDLVTAPELALAIEACEKDDPPYLLVDFGEVSFIDVSGLRVLLEAARRANAAGRRFVLGRPDPHIRRLLELTAIDQSLEIASVAASAPAYG